MLEWNAMVLTLAQEGGRQGGAEDGGPAPTNNGGQTTEGADGSPNQPVGEGGETAPPGGAGGWGLPMLLLVFLIVMVGMTIFSQRREKKKRKALIESISKNDRVVTIGGVIGTVVEIRENEVILKVDESSNTRMRFSKSAIQSIVGQED